MYFNCRHFEYSDDYYWSFFWENEPDDKFVLAKKGHLFGQLSLRKSENNQNDIKLSGKQLVSEIDYHYFSNLSLNNKDLYFEIETNLLEKYRSLGLEIDLLITIVNGQDIYIYSFGDNNAYLLRKNQFCQLILDGEKEVSGKLCDKDIFIFSDSKTIKNDTEAERILGQNDMADMTDMINDMTNKGQRSCSLIKVNFDETDINRTSSIKSPIFKNSIPVFSKHRSKKTNIVLAVAVLGFMLISILVSYKRQKTVSFRKESDTISANLEQKMKDLLAIERGDWDNIQSASKEFEEYLNQIENSGKNYIPKETIDKYRLDVSQLMSQTGSKRDDLEAFFDTSLMDQNNNYTKIKWYEGQLLLVDKTNKSIDLLDQKNKSYTNILKDGSDDELKVVFPLTKDLFTIDTKNKIFKISGKKMEDTTQKLDPSIEVTDIEVWGKSIYVLSKDYQVLKSTYTDRFSGFNSWLKEGQTIDGEPKSLAIDGNVWILSAGGTVNKFYTGIKKDSPYKNIENGEIMRLDPKNRYMLFATTDSKILVYDKDGNPKGKYDYPAQIADFVIDQSGTFAYILCANKKIYTLDISKL